MQVCTVSTFDAWRTSARQYLTAAIPPPDVRFRDDSSQLGLFEHSNVELPRASSASQPPAPIGVRVSRHFMTLAQNVACHRYAGRFDLLYRALWRLSHGEPQLLEMATDDDVCHLLALEKSVRRDAHKMKAFVRFRRVVANGQEQFIAWHRPDHRIARMVAPFFARRFSSMHWTILTPDDSLSWDQERLLFGPGVAAHAAPQADELEDLWRTYYASIFNPARLKLKTMIREMPVRHWQTLPETVIIPDLLAGTRERVLEMIELLPSRSAVDYLPNDHSFASLRAAAAHCRGCDLHCHATQTVFGEGPGQARIMLVGEQPGDIEDQQGRPFVGPAGKVLDDALRTAGLARNEVYLTNAVKHFKFVLRGKRRIHNKPSIQEAIACRPWLETEINVVQPHILVCLGATAAQSLIGTDFRITKQRGHFFKTTWCDATIGTYHPSAVLRALDPQQRARTWSAFLSDLELVAGHLGARGRHSNRERESRRGLQP